MVSGSLHPSEVRIISVVCTLHGLSDIRLSHDVCRTCGRSYGGAGGHDIFYNFSVRRLLSFPRFLILSVNLRVYVALVSMAVRPSISGDFIYTNFSVPQTCRIILNIRTFDSDSSEWLSNIRSGELTIISDTSEDSIFKVLQA